MPLTRCEISRKTPEQAMQTKVPTVRLTHCGSLVVQSAHFLFAGRRCRARITSSGDSCLRVRERGVGRRSEVEPGGASMVNRGLVKWIVAAVVCVPVGCGSIERPLRALGI